MPQYGSRSIGIAVDESLSARMNHLADQSAGKDHIPCGSPRPSGCRRQACLLAVRDSAWLTSLRFLVWHNALQAPVSIVKRRLFHLSGAASTLTRGLAPLKRLGKLKNKQLSSPIAEISKQAERQRDVAADQGPSDMCVCLLLCCQ